MRFFGPGLVWAAAAIGSGELIIASKTGAEHGLAFLWAIWLGVWIKAWIQRGILEWTLEGDAPILELWSRLPGGRLISAYWLAFFLLTALGLSGLLGLTASIAHALVPGLGVRAWAAVLAVTVVVLGWRQDYAGLERLMLALCLVLTAGALGTAALARPSPSEILAWDIPRGLPAAWLFLSLLGWGAGSGPDLMIPYSDWVVEKSREHGASGARRLADARLDNALGYLVTGLVASVFMIAGAAVLGPRGVSLEGLGVIEGIASALTGAYGPWVYYPFMIPAFAALFSTTLGVFDGGRVSCAHLARLVRGRAPAPAGTFRRAADYRAWLVAFAALPLLVFFGFPRPVLLVTLGAVASALAMPVLSGLVLYGLVFRLPPARRPGKLFLFHLAAGVFLYTLMMFRALSEFL